MTQLVIQKAKKGEYMYSPVPMFGGLFFQNFLDFMQWKNKTNKQKKQPPLCMEKKQTQKQEQNNTN